jgi:alkanesulfonate monooxygenase SsuD/methylene tetrahydromethanopterin reductase-like flavin-dependent oxidoreductase (luciferase family)
MLHGRPGGDLNPSWQSVHGLALTAEEVGFDMFVFEDVLMYRGETTTAGCWESMAIAGALASSTDTIRFGQSVVNSPYRSPALTASMATTLDEISGGRFVLGLGAGNSAVSDYEGFGFPTDHRYSRFAESIEIIHTLLRQGHVDYHGAFYSAKDAELVLRGPSPQGPEINIAAGGPLMLKLAARYADSWNWWTSDETIDDALDRLTPLMTQLDAACEAEDRDPSTLKRTLDMYSVTPPGLAPDPDMSQPLTGNVGQLTEALLQLGNAGFDEVRCDLTDRTTAGVQAFAPVVKAVHNA